MKVFPEAGWDDEPFEVVIHMKDGTQKMMSGVTVNTLNQRVAEWLYGLRYFAGDHESQN